MTDEEIRNKFKQDVQTVTMQLDNAFNQGAADKQVLFILITYAPKLPGGGCVVTTNGVAKGDVVEILKVQSDLLAAQMKPAN